MLPRRDCPGYEDAMVFVVLLHYTRPLAEVDAVLADHRRHLEEWAARGAVHAWARRDPPTGAILICVAPDRAAVERMVAQDPYVKAGVATPEIVEVPAEDVRGTLRG
jgi:uncharacterized protein YciI